MDQIYQLQQQIQRLRQEINNISEVCSTLGQSEQANALQLQQLQQKEAFATQGLRRIQQSANSLNQELNQISNVAQQIMSQMQTQRGYTTNISAYGAGISPTTGVFGQTGFNQFGTGQFGYTGQQGAFTGLAGQAGFNQLGAGQFGYAGQQGAFTGITAQQNSTPNQTYSQLSSLPYNMNTFVNQLHPYRAVQGFNQGQISAANQFGTGSQATAGIGTGQFGGTTQAFSGLGTGNQNLNQFGAQNANLAGNQNAGLFAATSPLSSISGTGTSLQGYSPYQANQFGFR